MNPEAFKARLDQLRTEHGESKDDAAQRIGIGTRQYNRWTKPKPDITPRMESIRLVAGAYEMSVGEFIDGVAREHQTLSDRLDRLEAESAATSEAVQTILRLVRDELLPATRTGFSGLGDDYKRQDDERKAAAGRQRTSHRRRKGA